MVQAGTREHVQLLLERAAQVRFGLLGLGVAGQAVLRYLQQCGVQLVAADDRAAHPQRSHLERQGGATRWCWGELDAATFEGCDAVFCSPGISAQHVALQGARQHSIVVFGELALWPHDGPPVVAVTGTNGKSTVTSWLGHMCQAADLNVFVGGNLGRPIGELLLAPQSYDAVVLELSSYQLEYAAGFAPEVAVVLNLSPDHLDRYVDCAAYYAAKQALIESQNKSQWCVLNGLDEVLRSWGACTAAQVLWLQHAAGTAATRGAQLKGKRWLPQHLELGAYCPVPLEGAGGQLPGAHNVHNGAMALLAFWALLQRVAADDSSRATLWRKAMLGHQTFLGLEHRLEVLPSYRGVQYINDSKATNAQAAAVALRACDAPTWLLAGGLAKGEDYTPWVDAARSHVKGVLAFGAAARQIEQAFASLRAAGVQVECVGDLQSALQRAYALAVPGDTVLLAPGCASFDAFDNYEARGHCFKRYVAALCGQGEAG